MAGHGWNLVEMAGNDWKWHEWLEMAGIAGLAGNGWTGWKWLEMTDIAGNCWKLMEMTGNGRKWLYMADMVKNQMGRPYHSFDCVLFKF